MGGDEEKVKEIAYLLIRASHERIHVMLLYLLGIRKEVL